jgi:hypothetical protein
MWWDQLRKACGTSLICQAHASLTRVLIMCVDGSEFDFYVSNIVEDVLCYYMYEFINNKNRM